MDSERIQCSFHLLQRQTDEPSRLALCPFPSDGFGPAAQRLRGVSRISLVCEGLDFTWHISGVFTISLSARWPKPHTLADCVEHCGGDDPDFHDFTLLGEALGPVRVGAGKDYRFINLVIRPVLFQSWT